MRWCLICKTWKESWTDRGNLGQNYEKRCGSCNNYTLTMESEKAQIQVPLKRECMRPLGIKPSHKK